MVQPDGKGAPISARQIQVRWALRDDTSSETPSTGTYGEEPHVQFDRALKWHRELSRLGAVKGERVVLAKDSRYDARLELKMRFLVLS